ncbi:MAG: leucine-rich repeat protein [Lachnospiraceae bacterium]|nr:leucine-rich repeat protein [Lachnospiraceae bacterium]
MKRKLLIILLGTALSLSACAANAPKDIISEKEVEEGIAKLEEAELQEKLQEQLESAEENETKEQEENAENTEIFVSEEEAEFLALTEGINWDFPETEDSLVGSDGENSYMDDKYNYYYLCQDKNGNHYASAMMFENDMLPLVVELGGERVPVVGLNSLSGEGNSFTIPSQFKAIYGHCGDYEEVTVPEGVLTVGAIAFANDSKLKKLKLPDSLQLVGPIALNAENLCEIEWNGDTYTSKEDFFKAFNK